MKRCEMCLLDYFQYPVDLSGYCAQCDFKVECISAQAKAQGAAEEREACAKLCELEGSASKRNAGERATAFRLAEAIRARGEKLSPAKDMEWHLEPEEMDP